MHKSGSFFVCAGLLGLALLLPRSAAAAWPADSLVNVSLCTATGDQCYPTSVSDGAGGAIVTWHDERSGNQDIYAQRISVDGTVQWTADGVALCTATGEQEGPTITSDGAGGAIVTWHDERSGNGDIYAQRISADGTPLWTANGVALCTATGEQEGPTIASDGAAGAIVAWQDQRSGNGDIYAQRISAAGTVQWTANGVGLCTATGSQYYPTSVSDDAGGAIVTWYDERSGTNSDIYAQRISAAGAVQWTANGAVLCTATGNQYYPTLVSDGAGGAIVTWYDYRSGNYDIYAQRISAAGTVQWTANGVALCTTTGEQYTPTLASDGAGGAIVIWDDFRSGTNSDIYAQRISAAGAVQWTANGVALCTDISEQEDATLVSDGAGGVIVTWDDNRGVNWDIYAQRISAAGAVQWTADGEVLCTALGDQWYPTVVPDGAAGAIVAWQDQRSGNWDIHAQRIWADGTTPVLLSFVSVDVGVDHIDLTWFAGGSESAVATVYRCSVGAEWTRIGEVAVDGMGYLRYTDRVDATATRLGYRLGIVDAGVEGFYGEVWVDLPTLDGEASFALTLDPVRPNPAAGGALTAHFTLASAAPASLELLDVAGRRIVAREVGPLGAGHHAFDLGEGRRLAPGLYLVCLRQGTSTRVARVAVLE